MKIVISRKKAMTPFRCEKRAVSIFWIITWSGISNESTCVVSKGYSNRIMYTPTLALPLKGEGVCCNSPSRGREFLQLFRAILTDDDDFSL